MIYRIFGLSAAETIAGNRIPAANSSVRVMSFSKWFVGETGVSE